MSVEVADLVATLGLNAAAFDSGMVAAEARAKTGTATLRLAFGAIGIGAAAALGDMVKHAADFESITQTLANNTNMGATGLAQMRAGVLQLAQQTGQPLEALSDGWMHIANHAYEGAAAMNIAAAAAKNAAATGGNAADDMNVLAGIMREYGVSAAQAGKDSGLATRYMDVLHNAVANSNFTMKDFVEGSKRAFAVAGSMGVPISQVTAQLAVLSEHGFPSAAIASLNWSGMLRSLAGPHGQALKEFRLLSKGSVDLVGDIKRLQKDGAFLPQFLADIAKATHGDRNQISLLMNNKSSYAEVINQLLRNSADVKRVQGLTDAAQAGRTMPGMVGTNEAFAAWSKTANAQMDILRGTFQSISVEIGSVFLPALNRVLGVAVPWVQTMATWVGQHQRLAAGILGGVAALGTLAGGMAVVSALSAPLAALLGAISLPLVAVAAAAAGLAVAWAHDWGGIREKAATAWGAIQPILHGLQTELRTLGELFKIGGAGLVWTVLQSQLKDLATAFVSWVPGAAAALTTRLATLLSQLGGWIRSVGAPALATHVQTWADAFWGWVRQAVPPLLREVGTLGGRLWGWITGTALPTLTTHLVGWATAFRAWVGPATTDLLSKMPPLLDRLGGWITGAVQFLGPKLSGWVSAFWHWVQPATANLLNHMPALLTGLGNWITHAVETLGPKLAGWVGAFWHWVREVGPPMMRELAALVAKVGIYAVGASLKFAAWLVPKWPDLMAKFGALLINLGTWWVTTALPKLWGFGNDMGAALVQGVLDTISDLGPQITAALGALVQKAVSQIPGAGGALNMLGGAGGLLGGLLGGNGGTIPNPYIVNPFAGGPFATARGPLDLTAFRNTATPLIAGPPASARGGAGGARTSNVTVNITRSGTSVSGGTEQEKAMGRHVGAAADAALLELEEALRRGGPSAQRLLGGGR